MQGQQLQFVDQARVLEILKTPTTDPGQKRFGIVTVRREDTPRKIIQVPDPKNAAFLLEGKPGKYRRGVLTIKLPGGSGFQPLLVTSADTKQAQEILDGVRGPQNIIFRKDSWLQRMWVPLVADPADVVNDVYCPENGILVSKKGFACATCMITGPVGGQVLYEVMVIEAP
jgi:hypothetical protein